MGMAAAVFLNRVIALVKSKRDNLKISTKIMLFYFLLLVFSISVSSFFYQRIYSNIISGKVSEMSMQTLYSISANIETVLDNANNCSKAIFTNDDIQLMLKNSKPYVDLVVQNRVNTYLIKLTETIPGVSSVYMFDNYGNEYSMDKAQIKALKLEGITEAPWYGEAVRLKGQYLLRLNAGGIFADNGQAGFISLIRIINDMQSQQPIGTLIVNVPESSFRNSYKNLMTRYETEVMLLDENDRSITKSGSARLDSTVRRVMGKKDGTTEVVSFDKREYLVSYLHMRNGWKLISLVPFGELSKESSIFNLTAFIVILLNSFLLFIGSIFISRLITTPVKKLLRAMKSIENNEFRTVDIKTGNDEFGKLRDGYNMMILEIQKLIGKIMEEQKIKRKAELNALQAQIKPHFLYNTFDAISSLALSGRNKEVYTVIKALGSYYRISLSKGSEVITLMEEVEMVRNYLTIQKIRYGDIFSDSYEIEPGLEKLRILKLVLQPLVENALYHGIKPKGRPGTIRISAVSDGVMARITVEDNGIGMSGEWVERINRGLLETGKSGFGLKGTVERLRIFYGIENVLSVSSSSGLGTKVVLAVPYEAGE